MSTRREASLALIVYRRVFDSMRDARDPAEIEYSVVREVFVCLSRVENVASPRRGSEVPAKFPENTPNIVSPRSSSSLAVVYTTTSATRIGSLDDMCTR
jgi:hypothetical protein